jgi:hypothetical protein
MCKRDHKMALHVWARPASLASLVACLALMAAAEASAHQPLEHARSLLQNGFNPNERQYMQITVSLDATCAQVAATSGRAFLNAVKLACLEDTRVALEVNPVGIADMGVTLKSVRAMPPNCTDITVRATRFCCCSLLLFTTTTWNCAVNLLKHCHSHSLCAGPSNGPHHGWNQRPSKLPGSGQHSRAPHLV